MNKRKLTTALGTCSISVERALERVIIPKGQWEFPLFTNVQKWHTGIAWGKGKNPAPYHFYGLIRCALKQLGERWKSLTPAHYVATTAASSISAQGRISKLRERRKCCLG